jgi:hypothetical protein
LLPARPASLFGPLTPPMVAGRFAAFFGGFAGAAGGGGAVARDACGAGFLI